MSQYIFKMPDLGEGTVEAEVDRRAREISEARWREITGAPDSALLRASVGWMADEVAKLARKRPGGVALNFWQQRACEYVAAMLRGRSAIRRSPTGSPRPPAPWPDPH